MQASLGSSDLVLLWVWRGALVLSAVALLIAFGLAFKRWLEERARRGKRARRERMARLVQALLASTVEINARNVPPLDPLDEGPLFGVALDILRVTRGRDADRLLALLEIWNLRPFLTRLLAGNRRSRQIRVLTLLARFRDRESLALLLRYLDHPAIYVQLAALRGIADRGEVAHLPEAVRALSRSRETNVPMLADILRRFGEPAVPSLAMLARDREALLGVRLASVTALGNIGALTAFDPLCELTRDPGEALRSHALEALARLGDPRAAVVVLEGLVAPAARVRAAAARTAGLLGLREALPSLASALRDEVWEVRYRAAEALYLLGAPGVAVLRATAAQETANVPENASAVPDSMAASSEDTREAPDKAVTDEVTREHAAAAAAREMAVELLAEKEGLPA